MFEPSKKITKIVTTVGSLEYYIKQINFFSGEELLCYVGYTDDEVKRNGGRVITFEIAADEQLIGATVYTGDFLYYKDYFAGVEWMKWKIPK